MKEYFINLFEYESWANREIVNSLLTLNDPPEKAISIMSHIIDAQILWLCRIKNINNNTKVWQLYDKSEISDVLKKSSLDFNEFVSNISKDDLEKIIEYINTQGEKFKSSVKDILTHLAIHSAYHRGQIILLIKPFVAILPYTDFIHFVRNIKK